ncbi:MAG: hypothetical protein AAGD11_17115 [Planctomycetota bacterium]
MTNHDRKQIQGTARTAQIIITALVMGILGFAVFVLFLGSDTPQDESDSIRVVTVVAACFAIISIVLAKIVPPVVQRNMRRNILEGNRIKNNISAERAAAMGDVKLVAQSFLTTQIISAALPEGAAFMNLVAFMLEQQIISLVIVAALVTTMFFKFPSATKTESWIEGELQLIEAVRPLREPTS